ncbi:hypothetical protein ACFL5L_02105 [candidate division KSB1 bacterium]
MKCWNCGKSENLPEKPGRRDLCPHCNKNLHCCLNCELYDKNAHHQCREPQAEWVKDKESANFCDYFIASKDGTAANFGRKKLSKDDARKKWDELFKR